MGFLTDYADKIGIGTFPIATIITIVITFIILAFIVGVLIYYVSFYRLYNKKIIIFTDINGRPEIIGRDRARSVRIGKGGDQIFFFAKNKKYMPEPSIQTGKRTYWYWIREDGEWFNIGLRHVDEQFREVEARFLDKEMRYARTQLQHKIEERYKQQGFWAKYGNMIISVVVLFVLLLFLFLIVREMAGVASAISTGVEASKEVLEATKEVIGALDNLQGGSGIRAA